jgi:hypothetical protein
MKRAGQSFKLYTTQVQGEPMMFDYSYFTLIDGINGHERGNKKHELTRRMDGKCSKSEYMVNILEGLPGFAQN